MSRADPATVLRALPLVILAVVVGPILLLGVLSLLPPVERLGVLLLPGIVAGLAAPIVAYVIYRSVLDRTPPHADRGQRARRFAQATIVALAVTEGASFVGILAFAAHRQLPALVGLATHVLLAVAIWPGRDRSSSFVGEAGADHS